MKIDLNKDLAQSQVQNSGKGSETANVRPSSDARAQQDTSPANSSADRVDLSDTALKLSQLDTAPEDNSDRIAALKAAIDNGTYEINATQVAEKLMDMEGLV
jgi:negative regulator of flagellin synthesis FlgM